MATKDTTPAPGGSQQFIAELAREVQLAQLQTIDGLDTKAANLIGFVGIVLGLIFTSDITINTWNHGLTTGTALLAAAALPLGGALLPRRYKFNPNIAALRRVYLNSPAEDTATLVVDSIVSALTWNSDLLRWRVRLVRVGAIFAVLGLVVTGAALLYAVIHGR